MPVHCSTLKNHPPLDTFVFHRPLWLWSRFMHFPRKTPSFTRGQVGLVADWTSSWSVHSRSLCSLRAQGQTWDTVPRALQWSTMRMGHSDKLKDLMDKEVWELSHILTKSSLEQKSSKLSWAECSAKDTKGRGQLPQKSSEDSQCSA